MKKQINNGSYHFFVPTYFTLNFGSADVVSSVPFVLRCFDSIPKVIVLSPNAFRLDCTELHLAREIVCTLAIKLRKGSPKVI